MRLLIALCYLLISSSLVYGQLDLGNEFKQSNPVLKGAGLSIEDKLELHTDYLNKSISEGDLKNQLFGHLYIFMDHIVSTDYTRAAESLFKAELLAEQSKNSHWIGWVAFRSGRLYMSINQVEKAMEQYNKAVVLCDKAVDTTCFMESFEKIAFLEGYRDVEKADSLYREVLPLIKAYGDKRQLGTCLNNYGALLGMKGDYDLAVATMKEGIEVNLDVNRVSAAAKGMNNLGQTYLRLEQYDEALELYTRALQLNREHGFSQNIIQNYFGLHKIYDAKNEHEKSMGFLVKQNELKDSLAGVSIQWDIAQLESSTDKKKIELELDRTTNSRDRAIALVFLFLVLLLTGLWLYRVRLLRAKKEKAESETSLKQLTKILENKNAAIVSLNNKIAKFDTQKSRDDSYDELELLVNSSILTKDDWSVFKSRFSKVYPDYIVRLREEYSSLSDAEERMFLLLKLQLKTREIAGILGISPDSVKKTRQRLRKRLELNSDVSLGDFVNRY